MKTHTPGALHDGFDDHRGELVGVFGQLPLECLAVGRLIVGGHGRGENLGHQD